MDFIERFRDPESITDYHLVAFIIQLVVIAGVVLGFYKFIMVTDAGRYELDTEDTFISSVIKDLKTEEGEEKFLRKIPSLNSDHEKVQTDRFIDIKNQGLWLTDKQDVMFTGYLLGMYFANIILVVLGAGPLYRRIKEVLKTLSIKLLPGIFLIFPFIIWAGIMCGVFYIMGITTMFLAPFILAYHLIMGIIQIVIKIKD